MEYFEVAPLKIVRASSGVFTYHAPSDLQVTAGLVVKIPVGKKELQGLVVKKVPKPAYETKAITSVVEATPLPAHLLETAQWLSNYYTTHLATVLQTVLPRGLDKKRRQQTLTAPKESVRERTKKVLNTEQAAALTSIKAHSEGTILLQGITGSGKTEVYKTLAADAIKNGRSAIILVPEISLTSQLVDEFAQSFPDTLITHSQMTEAQRHVAWRHALTATKPLVIVGPRSALFMPVQNLGLVVIDEAHEPSYKQESAPRYSALRAATMMGRFAKARVIFGSATPLIADRYVAEKHGTPIVKLNTKARTNTKPTTVTVVNMTKRDNFKQHHFLSNALLKEITHNLAHGQQSLIFHNRRGTASTTLCETCGWTAECGRCFIPYVLHTDTHTLQCHVCGVKERIPTACPVCHDASIIHKGIGTKRIEAELARMFPKARIARFDSDNTKEETVAARYNDLYTGEVDIIIGTQVVAKGLDLPKLRTVGVIQADSGLILPDFAADERAFQLLAQVVGRVGRDERATNVIVQSYQPDHPVIRFGTAQDYDAFYEHALEERQRGNFPPFRYLLQLTNVYKTEAAAIRNAQALARNLRSTLPRTVEVLGPTPAFYERQHDTYRWQLILKSARRTELIEALKHLPPTHWQSELDPHSLI